MVHLVPLESCMVVHSKNLVILDFGSLFNGGHMVFWFAQYILVVLSYGSLLLCGRQKTWFTSLVWSSKNMVHFCALVGLLFGSLYLDGHLCFWFT